MQVLVQDSFDLPNLENDELLSYFFLAKDDWTYASSLTQIYPLSLYRKARLLHKEVIRRGLLSYLECDSYLSS